ncbi:MAG: carbonic anhydrase [Alcaligenaceae bacterium]|nr:carbonic anhydrase [Alcaligenaceae bacterium]
MELYKSIFEYNQEWVRTHKAGDRDFFRHLSRGQDPDILYIGCSDSRVIAEDLTGMEPGQMFVHRNIANLVPNNDNSSASVIEYAISHLKVKHVVVCGHYFCGGIKAAMQDTDYGMLNPWLRNIRDVYRLHQDELNDIEDEVARYKRLVELNVEEQCVNIIKMAVWQKHYIENRLPLVHGWVFDVSTGRLIDLNIDLHEKIKEHQDIYDLGTTGLE